jgi:hypothetical protein
MSPNILNFSSLKTHKDLSKILLVGFLALAVLVATTLALNPQIFKKQASEDQISLRLLPSEIRTVKNNSYNIQIGINSLDSKVTASEIHLVYDPKKILIEDLKIEDFLPVVLKVTNNHDGKIVLILGGQLNDLKKGVGILATLKFKVLSEDITDIKFKPDTKVVVEGSSENVLKEMSGTNLIPAGRGFNSQASPSVSGVFPNNLKDEGVVFQDPSPLIRDIVENVEVEDTSIKPGFNFRYIKHLFTSLFPPISSLNKDLEDTTTGVIKKD